MKKNSPFQIVLLSTFGALAIVGVLIFSFYISKGAVSSIGSVTVWGTFDELSVQKALGDLMDKDPDLQNVHYVQKDAATYDTDLTNALASGTGPDLYFITQDQAFVQAPRLIALDSTAISPTQFSSTFVDGALPFTGKNGTVALPVLVDPLVLYWNKDLVSAAGFAQPPQYWDELYDFTVKVTQKNDAGTVTTAAIPFGTYSNVDHAKEIVSMLVLQAGGGITQVDQNGRLVSALMAKGGGAAQIAAVPTAVSFYTEYADPSKEDYTWNRSFPHSQKAFTDGTLALYIGYASEMPQIRAANPNLNFGVAPVPQVRGVKTAIDSGIVYGVAVPKAAHNPSGANAVEWLFAGPDVSAALSSALGIPSARRDLLSSVAKSGGDGRLAALEAIIVRTWVDPDPAKTDDIFRAMIDDTTSGAVLLSEAISRAEQQINNLIDQ